MRIVSLLPSATEVLYALGLGDSIIGVSHDCDYPPEVRHKPIVSSSTVNDELTSAEIDEAVGQTYHRGGSIYHIDPAFLERERPDLIIAQELCQVCAITSAEARRAAAIARSGAQILSLQPTTLAEVLESFRVLGRAVGEEQAASDLVARLQERIDAVRERLARVPERPRVLCLGWLDPVMAEGHWIPEMAALAGGDDGVARPGEHSRPLQWQDVVAYAPEAIVLMPCSFSLDRTVAEAEVLGERPGWVALPAVQAGRVYAVDSGYFSRPGPRLITGLEVLATCLHPERAADPLPAGAAARLAPGTRPTADAFTRLC